jgi:hypothetical protein
MTFLDEISINNTVIKFWSGFDLQSILSHPKNGSKGFMVVLVESIDSERIKFDRDIKLNKILNLDPDLEFDDILSELDNKYLALYQSRGEDEVLIKILKEKFHKSLYWQVN